MPRSGAPLLNPSDAPRRWSRAQNGRRIDPYKHPGKLVAPTVCPQCGAIYRSGRWQWGPRPSEAREAICQACHRSNDNHPAGVVSLTGSFVRPNRPEIVRLAEAQALGERQDHPLNRIIDIKQSEDRVVITTTDLHLPQRIGAAMLRTFQGTLDRHVDEVGYLVRVDWHRDA
jgi:hypothetical protein